MSSRPRSPVGSSCSRAVRSRVRPVASRTSARSAPALSGARRRPGHRAVAAPSRCRCRRSGICPRRPMSRRRFAPKSGSSRDPPPPFLDALARSIRTATRSCSRRRSRRCTRSRGGPRTAGAGRSGSRSKTRPWSTHCSRRPAVPTPPFEIVAAERRALAAAAARLDGGAGTVWAGDARDGFNGRRCLRALGRRLRRRRRCRGSGRAPHAALRAGPRRPFVEGIPCSIHGLVTDDGSPRSGPSS